MSKINNHSNIRVFQRPTDCSYVSKTTHVCADNLWVNDTVNSNLKVCVYKDLVNFFKQPGSITFLDHRNRCITSCYIEKVIFNNPATIVFFSDGSKVTCKVDKGDTYNEIAGLMICIAKKTTGSDSIISIINNWLPEQTVLPGFKAIVTLSDVRKKNKKIK